MRCLLECRELSWEAATERMLDAAELRPEDWPKAASKVAEATLFSAYNAALGTFSQTSFGPLPEAPSDTL